MYTRQRAIKSELARKEDYTDRIEETKRKLKELDKKLGVNTK